MGKIIRNIFSVAACTTLCLFLGVVTAYADVDIDETNFSDDTFRQIIKVDYDVKHRNAPNERVEVKFDWETKCTVVFDTNGHGVAPAEQKVWLGSVARNPGDLTDDGYKFGGWYKEVECTNQFDFDTEVVTADITLYAKWTKKSSGDGSGSGGSGGGRGGSQSSGTWVRDVSGWWYKHSNGNCPVNTWKRINSAWYYFKADGYMATGWQLLFGKWYYLGADGAMLTGWQQISGKWYYLYEDGHMAANENIGNYYVDTSGAWVQ